MEPDLSISYGIVSGCDIMPYIKIDKPLVVYIFSNDVKMLKNNLS